METILPPDLQLPMPPEALAMVLVGVLLLVAGRKLFWLALGIAGFALGAFLGSQLPLSLSPDLQLVVAVLCGLAGALAAALVKRIAIPVAGFLAGAFGAMALAEAFAASLPPMSPWIPFLAGGVAGLFLAALVVTAALIGISSLVGASTLLQPFSLEGPSSGFAFLALTLAGIAIQSRGWSRRRR